MKRGVKIDKIDNLRNARGMNKKSKQRELKICEKAKKDT